jgi:hypothetical protein
MALTSVFLDNFADIDNTLLTAHTPDTGIDWTLQAQSGGDGSATINNAESSVNQPFQSYTQWSYYMANFTESQSDTQEIEVTIGSRTVHRVALQVQSGTTGVDGYALEMPTGTSQQAKLYRVDETVDTQIDFIPIATGAAGDVYRLKINPAGDISVDFNGVPQNWSGTGTTVVNDTTHTGGNPAWLGKRTYSSTGVTKFEAFVDVGVGGTTSATTGTSVPTQDEDSVVTGGTTTILTLTNDTYVAAGATFDAQRQAIIDGVTSAQSELTGWNNEVRDKELVTSVVRTSDTVCTITWSASASYDITATETITATIPAAALVTSATPVVSSPTFTVTHVVAVPSITTEPLKNNTGQLLASETGVIADVYDTTDGTLVVRKTGLTSDVSGIVTFTDALMSAATVYRVVITLSGNEEGIARITSA